MIWWWYDDDMMMIWCRWAEGPASQTERMRIFSFSCSASIGIELLGNTSSRSREQTSRLDSSGFQVSKCCQRLVVQHQLCSGEWKGGGGLGGKAHGHRGEDEEEDEADAGRGREVRRRGHLRDDQFAAADVEQNQAEPDWRWFWTST